ncbi:MAG TPA: hypothetical protein PKA37_04310, partial [Planctomycetota bacterium]|nr:hypothetical protein [Planctomycetota bacterium]
MRWSLVRILFTRELRDVLRDRRTLFTMLVLPVILYPALMVGFGSLTKSRMQGMKDREYPVMISVEGRAITEDATAEPGSLLAALQAVPQFRLVAVDQPREAV